MIKDSDTFAVQLFDKMDLDKVPGYMYPLFAAPQLKSSLLIPHSSERHGIKDRIHGNVFQG